MMNVWQKEEGKDKLIITVGKTWGKITYWKKLEEKRSEE